MSLSCLGALRRDKDSGKTRELFLLHGRKSTKCEIPVFFPPAESEAFCYTIHVSTKNTCGADLERRGKRSQETKTEIIQKDLK